MSAMDDFFGPAPGRPDHPDFWKLSGVLLLLDGRMESVKSLPKADQEAVFVDTITEIVDLESIVYVAQQRAVRVLPPDADLRTTAVVTSIYIDAFIAGANYERSNRGD